MTERPDGAETRPISVAELLARSGTIGAPPPAARRHRRRRNNDAVKVTELAGETPVAGAGHGTHEAAPEPHAGRGDGADGLDGPVLDEAPAQSPRGSEPQSHSPGESPTPSQSPEGPEPSPYAWLLSQSDQVDTKVDTQVTTKAAGSTQAPSDAEGMNPDPLEDYTDMPVDVMDTDVRNAEPATEDSAYVRSYLHAPDPAPPHETAGEPGSDEDYPDIDDDEIGGLEAVDEARPGSVEDGEEAHPSLSRTGAMLSGSLVVLQSVLAVAFGAGLFIAFEQLWQWNNITALLLSVLVILGLVAGVRIVRKTEDIGSTLTEVAVGALVTLGPLVLLQSG